MDRGHELLLQNIITRLDQIQSNLGSGGGGDASAANQTLQINELQNIITELQNRLNTLGQKTNVASAPVTLSTEQQLILSSIMTKIAPGGNSTITTQAATQSNVTLLGLSLNRVAAVIVNDTNFTMYIKYGATAASPTSFTRKLFPHESVTIRSTKEQINAIWSGTDGGQTAKITEIV